MNKNQDEVGNKNFLYKHYLRYRLRELGNSPFIVSCKFKRIFPYYVTFSCIRPYIYDNIKDIKTYMLFNHVNVRIDEAKKAINIQELIFNRRYYLFCHAQEYSNNRLRMGISLAFDIIQTPIIISTDMKNVDVSVIKQCYRFDKEEWQRETQKKRELREAMELMEQINE